MKHKRLIFIILPFLLIQCSTWYNLNRKNSTYYTPSEKIILEQTTACCGFGYGYDPDLDLDYIFTSGSFSDKELDSKSKSMRDVLAAQKKEDVIRYYEKIFILKEMTMWDMNEYMRKENWANYTLLKKYILPDMEKYLTVLEKNVLIIDPGYRELIEGRKQQLYKQVVEAEKQKKLQEEEAERQANERN